MVLNTHSVLLLATNVESQSNLNALTSKDQLAPSLSPPPASPQISLSAVLELTGLRDKTTVALLVNIESILKIETEL
jgi:hypothetical protein